MRRANGNTLVEYGIIGGLILAVSIVVMMVLGGNLNQTLLGLKHDFQKSAGAANPKAGGPTTPMAGSASGQTSAPVTVADGIARSQQCFGQGLCLDVPVVDPADVTDTAGGNGGKLTHAMASVYQQLADQLEAQNEDPALVDMLRNLANQGHTLGDSEQSLINFCPPGATCDKSAAAYNTSAQNLGQLQNQKIDTISTSSAQFASAKASLNDFLQRNPALLPPPLQQTVNTQADNIQNIAFAFQGAQTGVTATQTKGDMAVSLQMDPAAAHKTHGASNRICAVGGGPQCMRKL